MTAAARTAMQRLDPLWVSRRRLALAGCALLLLLYTALSDHLRVPGLPTSINVLAITLAVIGLVLGRWRNWTAMLRWDPVLTWMVLYGASIGLSVGWADPASGLHQLAIFGRELLVVALLLNLVQAWTGLRLAVWSVVAAGVVLAAASLLQLATGWDFGGLAHIEISQIVGQDAGPRLAGTVGESDLFGQLLVPVVVLSIYAAWASPTLPMRLSAYAASLLIGVVVMLTYSRGSLVALSVGLAIAFEMQRSQPRRWMAALIVIGVLVIAAPQRYWERAATLVEYPFAPLTTDDSLALHSTLWTVGGLLFLEHPLTGIGKGNYAAAYDVYAPRLGAPLPSDGTGMGAHDVLVRVAAETGALGLLAWLGAIGIGITRLRRAKHCWSNGGRPDRALLLEGIEVALYTYLTAGLFLDDSYPRYLWLLVALAVIGRQLTPVENPVRRAAVLETAA